LTRKGNCINSFRLSDWSHDTRDGQEKTLRKLFKYEFYFEY